MSFCAHRPWEGFLSWLHDMLARRSTRSKLLMADAEKLRAKVREGKLLLDEAPFSKKQHSKHLRETNELLEKLIPPTHVLYRDFFPNRVLTREFEKGLAEQGLLSHKTQKLYEARLKAENFRKEKAKASLKRQATLTKCYSA